MVMGKSKRRADSLHVALAGDEQKSGLSIQKNMIKQRILR